MKKLNLQTLILNLILICTGSIAVNGQNSTQTQNSQTVTNEQAIQIMGREVAAARHLIKTQNEQITALTEQITLEQRQSVSLLNSYEAAKGEIAALRSANALLEKAVVTSQATIDLLQNEQAKARARGDKWKKRTLKVGAILAAGILTKIL